MQNSLTPQMSKKPQMGTHSHSQSEQAVTPMSGKSNYFDFNQYFDKKINYFLLQKLVQPILN